ncbi:hypothetical protein QJQ45_026078, partial [Haematococcus lacustris]
HSDVSHCLRALTSLQPYSNAIAYGSSAPNPLLREFWSDQMREVEQVPSDPAEFKNHQLPLARIKKARGPGISPCDEVQIMKSDEDVRMISAEAPVLFAKRLQACEMFILELTLRAWQHAEENKRRTLQRNDVAAAITRTDIFDFLLDVVPREDLKLEDGASNALANTPASAAVPATQGLAPSPTQASMPAPPTPPAPHMASAASMSMQQPPLGGWCPTSLAHGCLPVEHNRLNRSAWSRWWLSLGHAGMSMYPAFPMYPGAPGGMGQGMDPSHMMMGMGPPFMGMP